MNDKKFITFRRDEMEKWMSGNPSPGFPIPVPDAVVIRRQDVFAAPAFDAYANAMLCVIEALQKAKRGTEIRDEKPGRPMDYTANEVCERLLAISDYFHMQASLSYDTERKLPD